MGQLNYMNQIKFLETVMKVGINRQNRGFISDVNATIEIFDVAINEVKNIEEELFNKDFTIKLLQSFKTLLENVNDEFSKKLRLNQENKDMEESDR